jgi:hypothetical protein
MCYDELGGSLQDFYVGFLLGAEEMKDIETGDVVFQIIWQNFKMEKEIV